jgi:hypothetical protein
MAVLLKASRAVTVKLNGLPAVAVGGAETVKCVAAPALTTMVPLTPVMLLVTVSVAVIVWPPVVPSVTAKVPVPAVRGESAGSAVWLSELVKWTVPAYDVAVLLNASRAVAVTVKAVPAIALAGALTVKCVAFAAETAIDVVPVMLLVALSVAVSVWFPAVTSVTPLVIV